MPATNGIPTTGPIAGPGGSIFGQDNMSVFQLVPPVAGATAWTQQPVYTFPANALFEAGFLYAPTGVLYGALPFSGASGQGQIIALTPPTPGNATWTESVLYDFTSGKDGFAPSGGIALDASGALYGVSRGGKGAGCKGGCGTVFRLAPPDQQGAAWKYTLLHTFTGADGSDPFGVTLDRQGNLYGNTYQGGIASPGPCSAGCGTIFKLTKPAPGQTTWVETVAVIPSGRYGAGPLIPFIGTDNRLYDIASAGGEFDRGEAFALPENFK